MQALVLKRRPKNNLNSNQSCKGTGAEQENAGNMHEEPLSEEKRVKKEKKANRTGRFCHVASILC